jgi:photosystem II stability/assembly factor-like uncharacterized protein
VLATESLLSPRHYQCLKSNDNGYTWVRLFKPLPDSEYDVARDLCVLNNDTILIAIRHVQTQAYLLSGGDAGYSDVGHGLPGLTDNLQAYHADTIFMYSSGVWRSTDAGNNWEMCSSGLPSTQSAYCGVRIDSAGGVVCYQANGIYYSSDFGNSWTLISSGITNSFITDLVFDKNSIAYAASHEVIFASNGTLSNISNGSKPTRPSLFPNPCFATLNVSTEVNCELKLYDLTGREQYSLRLQPGVNQVNVSSLDPGAYLCRIDKGYTSIIAIQ